MKRTLCSFGLIALAAAAALTVATGPASALTPQREKFKSCAAGWSAYKTANTVTGRKAYDTYMAGCLKKPT